MNKRIVKVEDIKILIIKSILDLSLSRYRKIINVKEIEIAKSTENLLITLDTNLTPELQAEGDARDLIRSIQSLRKESNLELKDKIKIFAPSWPTKFEDEIKSKTLAESIEKSDQLKIEKIS